MPPRSQASRKVFFGLAFAIVLDTFLQLLWKSAVADIPSQPTLWQTLQSMARQPLFLLVGLLMAGQACNWVVVLDHTDLSYAHAITSLSYVSVAALSVLLLGESLTVPQDLGIALILLGVWFVGKSDHQGEPSAREAA